MFDTLDPVLLARIQFGFTVSFHFIFPSFSIGLASYLAVLEGLWLKTGKELYLDLFKYWVKIFAVAFAMGVVSGIVMSYQFGTNWSVFSTKAGPVIGPLMAYEVLTAFFLEAGFLGVMLFGMKKVGKGLHFGATLMVALGTFISAFWILSVNSWMQTPTGFSMNAKGQFVPSGPWLDIIFNPSFPYRLVHTVIAAYLTTALVVGAVGAWHLLRDSDKPHARKMFSMAMWMAALVAPVQIFAGDLHGINTLEHQPAKVMAMEGHFDSHKNGAPLILFGLPNQAEKRVDYAVEIPKVSSLILKHDLDAPLAGLDTIPDNREPPVAVVFWSFRVMVGIGFAILGLGLWSLLARSRGKLYDWPWLHRAALTMGPAGFVAVIAGWITTEVGRQPFTVYGHLLTAQSHSPLAAPAVAASLTAFVLVYFAVFGVGTWYILKLMSKPAQPGESEPDDTPTRTAGITPPLRIPPFRERDAMGVNFDLTVVWAFIIAFSVFMYIVLDGFDLGIGILFPVFDVGEERDQAMNSIAPVWDGNETWLVLGGGGLLAAFPLAYGVILTATYPLIIAMLLGLVFRGVAFEFRWRDPRHRGFWDVAFTGGSFLAAFAQGVTLGALLQGVTVVNQAYAGGWLDWLSPFSILTGVGVVAGYGLLGATWMIWRLEGRAQGHAKRLALYAAIATLLAIVAVSAATPFLQFEYWKRWFEMPGVLATAQVPLLTAIVAFLFFRKLKAGSEWAPFVLALTLFALCFAGLGVSIFPYIVPDQITIWDAAAPEKSQVFMLVGTAFIMPLILAYTVWAYWVFRGKVGKDGYH